MILKSLRERFRARAVDAPRATGPAPDPAKAAELAREGERLAALGADDDAADHFALALANDASLAAAWYGYGQLMLRGERVDAAITHLQQAVALAPGLCAAWLELARAFKRADRTPEAAAAYERAIAADPDDAAPYVNLALLSLSQLADPARAEALLRRAIALSPDSMEAQANLGLALHEQNRSDAAIEHYDRLLKAHPECVEYRWHRACVRLATGDFDRGWQDYEARKLRQAGWRLRPPFAEWDGRPLADGALLVYAEQGLGDEIMFASCIPDALRLVPQCVIECDERLGGLFRRSFPQALVHAVDRKAEDWSWLAKYPQITAQCAIGSLPRCFRRSREAFADRAPYLVADGARVERWRRRLGQDGALKVGIAWRGGTYGTRRNLRSTQLPDWAPVLSNRGARFYALQSLTPDERAFAEGLGAGTLQDVDAAGADIEELAAAVTALDLIISVQGAPVHLAGALGRPVWALLNRNPEWRYLNAGSEMPWYRTARLFRQPAPNAWDAVFASVAAALAEFDDARRAAGPSC